MEKTLQYEEATQCLGLPSTSPGNHRLNGPKAGHALTFTLDHSKGANHHRKDGRIVKAHDDLLDATRYGVMMLRFAKEVKDGKIKKRRPAVVRGVEYDVFGL